MSEKEIISTEKNEQETDVAVTDSTVSPQDNEKVSSTSNKKTVVPSAQLEANPQVNPTPVVITQTSKGWSFTAILLSLLALGASGFLYVEGKNQLKHADQTLEQKLNFAAVGNSENGRLLQQALSEQQKIINQFSAIDENIKLINQRYDNTEKSYKSLTTGRLQWLIDETEYTLNIASQQLMFSGDIQSTLRTLEVLERRLNRFNQAQLLPLKKAISEDYQLIKAQSYVDVVAASLRLDRLTSAIDTLPLFADSMLVPGELKSVVVAQKNNLNWYEDLWESIKSNTVNLVQVRKIDNADAMLISPEQAYFLRQNIKLSFLATRIALMQHQQDIYTNELNQIKKTISQYFDKHDQRTTVVLNEIDELLLLKLGLPVANNLKNSLDAISAIRDDFSNIEQIDGIGHLALEKSLNDTTTETLAVDAKESTPQPALDNSTDKALPTDDGDKSKEETNMENQVSLPSAENISADNQSGKGDNQ